MNEASGDESKVSHAGDVLDALRDTHPRISGLLHRADQARTLTLSILRSDASGALDAIEATSRFLHGMDDWVRKVPAPLATEFVARITSDFIDGVDGVLEHKVSAVLDPARDLMELSVLFREFRLRPKSFEQWQRADQVHHLGQFSFGRLLKRHPGERITGFPDIEEAFAEYTQHSRTLHPAMPLVDGLELARAPLQLPAAGVLTWVLAMIAETLRHAMIAVEEFNLWHVAREDAEEIDPSVDIDIDLEDIKVVRRWLQTHTEAQKDRVPPEFMKAFQAPYKRKPTPS
ncbi:hypothetical protein [Microbacterium dextranolyticum]|uniref:Uncharacterized protein n=1 Tax=Microbacterium dextranolyticum TaxID=36806 RepID=A0A9W6M460_9MICO|nr:hypothetical protein [Microbacterium dextranolyticum]MBM7461704.1 hypothetical protein [Microbacterium dextranolyticum]GLJ93944.1 hypothetical protein GCM10017591_00050 [Microbacterium dextranolyticum]